ncbi:predicted protein [Naegleria gruberi]|uniref:Predicted protein n=1 Tax=Naegleria gruberi TaxID=5762 RepID=D2VZC3_NAEGR|nr:uncharacterized protein NAEGRDRAFT_53462 [Naegleria gruberi]EFC37821.1 predicted protein [Naegleria gruberi]|eukprot:XP_002670565.1 predicted protein [Naegleria gruberi strain NEG-M]
MKVAIFHQNEEISSPSSDNLSSASKEELINDNVSPPKSNKKKFVELISNEKQAKAKIDEWKEMINDPNVHTVFYLDTEVGGFKTNSERLSCIQCLVVSSPRVNDQILRLFNPLIVPPSISHLLEEKREYTLKPVENVEEENVDQFIDNKVIREIESVLIRDALPNGKIVILDVLDMSDDLLDYFEDNIMFDERCEKVFHYKTFDLKFLGGASYCKNVSCTHEISSKYIPYHLLPISNYKLDTLSHYLTSRIISHINNVSQTSNDIGNLEEIKELLTYSNKKELQESDWFERPLSPTQVEYATQDVITLFGVHQLLINILVHQDNSFHLQSYFKYLYNARSADSEESPQDLEEEDSKNEYLLPLAEFSDSSKDITDIEDSIKEIEDEYKLLESKMSTLQDRIKQVMIRENITDTRFFKLSSSKRATQQVPLHLLVEHIANQRSTTKVKVNPINLPVGVTTTMKKALKEAGFADIPTQSIIKQESSSYRITKK